MLEQLLDRARDAVAVERIRVLVAGDHEERARLQTAAFRRHRRRCSRSCRARCSRPRSGSRRSSAFRSDPPARRRRAASDGSRGSGRPCRRRGSGRSQWLFDESRNTFSSAGEYQSAGAGVFGSSGSSRAGHVLPEELLERPDPRRVDRVLRVDGHPELAREEAEAKGVVGPSDDPVVVQVEPDGMPVFDSARQSDADRRSARRRSARSRGSCPGTAGGRARRVEVELVDQQHVRRTRWIVSAASSPGRCWASRGRRRAGRRSCG